MTTNTTIQWEKKYVYKHARVYIYIYYIPFYIKNSRVYIYIIFYMVWVGLKNRDRTRISFVRGEEFSWGPRVTYSRIGGCRSITFRRPNGKKKKKNRNRGIILSGKRGIGNGGNRWTRTGYGQQMTHPWMTEGGGGGGGWTTKGRTPEDWWRYDNALWRRRQYTRA